LSFRKLLKDLVTWWYEITDYHLCVFDSRISYDGLTSCPLQLIIHNYLIGQGLLVFDASRSHSDTPYSVGVLWTGDQTLQHAIPKETDIHSIRTRKPSKRVAENPLLTPRGHWDRLITLSLGGISFFLSFCLNLTTSTYPL
jgi:hypothetical protein